MLCLLLAVYLQNGDVIVIDVGAHSLQLDVPDAPLAARRAVWKCPPLKASGGYLLKYIKCVKSASEGGVTDDLL